MSAEDVLQRMLQAYRDATSYTDRGVVRLQYRQGDQTLQDEGRLEVAWARPNRLRVRAYQLTLISDGQVLREWPTPAAGTSTIKS